MLSFSNQLFGAWRALGLDASPKLEALGGGITFCCPRCAEATALEVADGLALCPRCDWSAEGEPWEVAKAGAGVKPGVTPSSPSKGLPLLDLQTILGYVPDPRDEIWAGGILSAGEPAAIVGAPGVGKSRLALQAAIASILGWEFLGWQTKCADLKWLFLQTENSTRRLKSDLSAMTQHMMPDMKARVAASLRILNVSVLEFASICMVDGHPDRERILDTLSAWPADVVVIDPLRDAGQGDPNKDADMVATCQAIGSVLKIGNPRRVPLVIHHGRTGSAEASRVFGDDAASFGRNSKVLYGWLRSQINVASAGIDYPGTIIVGCGKNSNGRPWEPFAARLCEQTMTYRRLDSDQFNIDEWAEKMGSTSRGGRRKKPVPTPAEVAEIVQAKGGKIVGGAKAGGGLVQCVMKDLGVPRADAITAIEAAIAAGAISTDAAPGTQPHGGGKPKRVYILKRRPNP